MGRRSRYVQYLFDSRAAVAKLVEDTRKLVKASEEILNSSRVDTFLGQRTQEPFPEEHQRTKGLTPPCTASIDRWSKSAAFRRL
jgi:hypothetical protein